jgi:hypothetical protein
MAELTSGKGQSKPKSQNRKTKKTPKTTLKDKIMGCKNTLSASLKIFILIFGIINNAEANQQQNYYTPQQSPPHLYQNYPTIPSTSQKSQYVIFNAIGEMASQMMYIHVSLPLNISTLYDQANLLLLKKTTTSEIKRIPFTKAARDIGNYGLKRLERIMNKLKEIVDNLPYQEVAKSGKKDDTKNEAYNYGITNGTTYAPQDVIGTLHAKSNIKLESKL